MSCRQLRPPKETPAETIAAARGWESTKNRYLTHGLCERCAAQAAWGHANYAGWRSLNDPCATCAPIVPGFDEPTTNLVWRKASAKGPVLLPTPGSALPEGHVRCRCGAYWTGHRAAHCAACHVTFTSVSGFDHHRIDGRCHDPAARGLVLIEKGTATRRAGFGFPGEYTRSETEPMTQDEGS
jgi:hypothetical protein